MFRKKCPLCDNKYPKNREDPYFIVFEDEEYEICDECGMLLEKINEGVQHKLKTMEDDVK